MNLLRSSSILYSAAILTCSWLPASAQDAQLADEMVAVANATPLAEMVTADVSYFYSLENFIDFFEQTKEIAPLLDQAFEEEDAEIRWSDFLEQGTEPRLWAEAFGRDSVLAISKEIEPWAGIYTDFYYRFYPQMMSMGIMDNGGMGFLSNFLFSSEQQLLDGFALVNGKLDAQEYAQMYGFMGTEAQMDMMINLARGIVQAEIPNILWLNRPSTEEGKDKLADSLEEFIDEIDEEQPEWITYLESNIGGFRCGTWSFNLFDAFTNGQEEISVAEARMLAGQMIFQGAPEGAELVDWVAKQEIVIAYGWDEKEETVLFFVGNSLDEIPFLKEGEPSLIEANPQLKTLLAEALPEATRLTEFTAPALSEQPLQSIREIWEEKINSWIGVSKEHPMDLRAKTLSLSAQELAQLNLLSSIEVNGSSVSVLSIAEEIQWELISGVRSNAIDYSKPIKYNQLFSLDAPLVVAGAGSPELNQKVLNVLGKGIPLVTSLLAQDDQVEMVLDQAGVQMDGFPFMFEEEVEEEQAADEELLAADEEVLTPAMSFEQWMRGAEGKRLVATLPKIGDRLAKGLTEQEAFVLDFAGRDVPGWMTEDMDEEEVLAWIPRAAWLGQVRDEEAVADIWPELSESLSVLVEQIGEHWPESKELNLSVPQPMTVEANDVKRWFFAVQPYTTNDFMPVVARANDVVVVSSANDFAQQLGQLGASDSAPSEMTGSVAQIRLQPLMSLLQEIKETNVNLDEEQLAEYEQFLGFLQGATNYIGDDKVIRVWTRDDQGMLRTTISFEPQVK